MQLAQAPAVVRKIEVEANHRFGIVDVTEDVQTFVESAGLHDGVVFVFCQHTTCGVVINELEDGLIEDWINHVTALVPGGYFAHDDLRRRTQNLQGPDEPANGPAHVRQIMFGSTSQPIPVMQGRLALGRWQRVLFVELDEPRRRSLVLATTG